MDQIPQIHLLVKFPRKGDLTPAMSDAMAGEFNRLIQYLQGRQTELAENADESVSKHAGFIVMLAAIATGEVNARAVPDLAAQDVGSWAGHMADLANGRWVNPARA